MINVKLTLVLIFKIVCGIVTCFMVGFWFRRFDKNEDVSQVQYISVKEMEEVTHPEVTICIMEPVLIQRLQNKVTNATVEEYLEYLGGNGSNEEQYKNVDFFNVTLNVFEYLQYPVTLRSANGSVDQTSCINENECPSIELRNSFNGYLLDYFGKCFSIGVSPKFGRNLREIRLQFDGKLQDVLASIQDDFIRGRGFMIPNHPNQFARYVDKTNVIWVVGTRKYMHSQITIAGTEILRRRYKRADPCIADWRDYDNFLMNTHLDELDCIIPYLKRGKPKCSNPSKLKESRYILEVIRNKFSPCQEMINIEIQYIDMVKDFNIPDEDPLQFHIQYPDQVKIIAQAPSVDLHALIGNIGGYIGLFLGMSLNDHVLPIMFLLPQPYHRPYQYCPFTLISYNFVGLFIRSRDHNPSGNDSFLTSLSKLILTRPNIYFRVRCHSIAGCNIFYLWICKEKDVEQRSANIS